MNDDDMTIERIWSDVERGLDEELSVKRRAVQKSALLDAVSAPAKRPARARLLPVAAAAVIVAGLAAVYSIHSKPEGVSFRVSGIESVGTEGMWIEGAGQKAATIEFENGSEMKLEKHASARVLTSNLDEVRVELLKGAVVADIEGNGRTRWIVQAGPYEVAVLGTTYGVYWDAEKTRLQVKVEQGSVLVKGAGLKEHGIKLTAGNHLSTDGRDVRVAMASSPSLDGFLEGPVEAVPAPGDGASADGQTDAQAAPEEMQVGEAAGEGIKDDESRRRAASTETDPKRPDPKPWIDLLDRGEFAAAVEAAERAGLDRTIDAAGLEDLWRLANAARYSKKGAAATKILTAVRKRFGGTRKAGTAAFLLGRIALELERDPAAARDWFLKYLTEEPTGRLAEEAWGRLINVYKTLGLNQKALEAAKAYIAQYPGGLFAKSAEATISEWENSGGRQ